MSTLHPKFPHLICDLDNTLYDWVTYFVPSFYAMVDEVINITSWDRDILLDEFRAVHQIHKNVEHPFALIEVAQTHKEFSGQSAAEIAKTFDKAFHAYNRVRKETLVPYPGVLETLAKLHENGVQLIAHTDSDLHAVVDRLNRLGVANLFDAIYCRSRGETVHPNDTDFREWAKDFPLDAVVELPPEDKKPNPRVLIDICAKQGITPAETAYVGDSLARDVYMAKSAGLASIWAKYGTHHHGNFYDKLVRITHWSAEDIRQEKRLSEKTKSVVPDFVLENGFGELSDIIFDSGC